MVPQEYFVYFKAQLRSTGGKDRLRYFNFEQEL